MGSLGADAVFEGTVSLRTVSYDSSRHKEYFSTLRCFYSTSDNLIVLDGGDGNLLEDEDFPPAESSLPQDHSPDAVLEDTDTTSSSVGEKLCMYDENTAVKP